MPAEQVGSGVHQNRWSSSSSAVGEPTKQPAAGWVTAVCRKSWAPSTLSGAGILKLNASSPLAGKMPTPSTAAVARLGKNVPLHPPMKTGLWAAETSSHAPNPAGPWNCKLAL